MEISKFSAKCWQKPLEGAPPRHLRPFSLQWPKIYIMAKASIRKGHRGEVEMIIATILLEMNNGFSVNVGKGIKVCTKLRKMSLKAAEGGTPPQTPTPLFVFLLTMADDLE